MLACSHLQDGDLTDLDKIFLLLAENNLRDCFNVLCYDLHVRTIADLHKLNEAALKRFRLIPSFAKDQLRNLPQKAEKADFIALALVGLSPRTKLFNFIIVPVII